MTDEKTKTSTVIPEIISTFDRCVSSVEKLYQDKQIDKSTYQTFGDMFKALKKRVEETPFDLDASMDNFLFLHNVAWNNLSHMAAVMNEEDFIATSVEIKTEIDLLLEDKYKKDFPHRSMQHKLNFLMQLSYSDGFVPEDTECHYYD